MGKGNDLGRDMAHEGLLHLEGRIVALGHETETVADAEHVGVDRHGRLAKCHCLDNIGRLAAHAGQTEQLVHVGGHLAAEALSECA